MVWSSQHGYMAFKKSVGLLGHVCCSAVVGHVGCFAGLTKNYSSTYEATCASSCVLADGCEPVRTGTLALGRGRLKGQIPTELGECSNLLQLDLQFTSFDRGPLPTELGRMTKLEALALRWSGDLSGTLPNEFRAMTNLESLDISFNSLLQGTIPSDYGSLTNLGTYLRMCPVLTSISIATKQVERPQVLIGCYLAFHLALLCFCFYY